MVNRAPGGSAQDFLNKDCCIEAYGLGLADGMCNGSPRLGQRLTALNAQGEAVEAVVVKDEPICVQTSDGWVVADILGRYAVSAPELTEAIHKSQQARDMIAAANG